VAGRRLIVETDGGSRGNPGNAGYGALVRDAATGEVIAQRAESIGIATNNVAEYSGLVAGLKAASEIDPGADVMARLDSKLLVEQMSGRWQVKSPDMRRLALWAGEIAAGITAAGGSVTYTWIPREENSAADELANSAMDGKAVSWTGQLPDAGASDVQPPDVGTPTRILLVRHGVTDFTAQGKLDGRGGADPGLNGQGWGQAHAAGAGVHSFVGDRPTTLITSSLQRAVETGGAIADEIGVTAQVDADWDEQSFGDWDGQSMGYLAASHPKDLLAFRKDPAYLRPGGEAHVELRARVLAAFDRAVEAGGVGGTVVVASHRKPIMTVLAHVLGIPHDRIWRLSTSPASLTCVEVWADGGMSVAFVNDTSHLH
jgi:probable phosphoglycerate mutase